MQGPPGEDSDCGKSNGLVGMQITIVTNGHHYNKLLWFSYCEDYSCS